MKKPAKPPIKKASSSAPRLGVKRPASPPAATPTEAQKIAAAILECLAGVRTPATAAEQLKISLPRYYQLEARALEGLVAALAPRALSKQPSLEKRVQQLEKQLAARERACARQEALVRLTQRSLGLSAPPKPAAQAPADGQRRKPRRPMVRALRAAQALRAQAETSAPVEASQPPTTEVQPTASSSAEPRP